MRGEQPQRIAARPMLEALEPRVLLDGISQEQAVQLFSASPALFAENQGQWADASVHYAFQRGGAGVAFTDDGLAIRLAVPVETGDATLEGGLPDPLGDDLLPTEYQTATLTVRFEGAGAVAPAGLDRQETLFNYFVGDQANWRSEVAIYAGIGYAGLYQGIDLEVSGDAAFLKYAFHVASGADWSQIGVTYDGAAGPLEITATGDLVINTAAGDLVDRAPVAWQEIGGQRVNVAVTYQLLDADTVGFAVSGSYDPSAELVIDPDLAWSTYLGGSDYDYGCGIAVDASGNVLVTGSTYSSGWTSGGFDTTYNGAYDAFVAKLSPTGGHIWSTYLGGSGWDYGDSIAVDASGNVLVTGDTGSSGWTSGGFDTTHNGGNADAFVAKLSPTGGHLWSTYLGGSSWDYGDSIAVDASGNVLVTGSTYSSGWTSGGFDTSYNDGGDAFVAKLSPTGGHIWSTYLGGSDYDYDCGIAVDASGNVLVTGSTYSSGWTSGGFDTTYNGACDAFVAKLSPTGGHIWSTYLGGSGRDYSDSIAVDASGNVLVTGDTGSSGWTSGGFDTSYNDGYYDAFVAKLSPTGGHIWSTYLGGSDYDYGCGIAVDVSGNVLVTGSTYSSGWTSGGFDTTHNGGNTDAFVAKLSPTGGHLWSTYLGGSSSDWGQGIAVDASGSVLVTGDTYSSGWTSGGFDTSYNDGGDAFVAKITDVAPDAGDSLSSAASLGALASGAMAVRRQQVGDGAYGSKDVDLYQFTLSSAGTVTLDVDAQSTGSPLDAYLRLFNASGAEMGWSDDVDGRDPYLSLSFSPGTYYVGVSGYANRYYNPAVAGSGVAGSTGAYTLSLSLAGGGGGSWSPVIAASSTYDGNPDAAVFGRYLTGAVVPDVLNTFTAYVSDPTGYTTTAVTFDSNFNGIRDAGDYTDTSSASGWIWNLNVSDLTGDKTLSIWAQESGGAWSAPAAFSIDTLAAPTWMDPELTTITFNGSQGGYEIESLIGQRFGEYTPTDWPVWLAYDGNGERTFNGMYFGTLVEADYSLSARVTASEINPVLGFSVFGIGPQFKFGGDSRSGSITIDPYQLWEAYTDPVGCMKEAMKTPRQSDIGKLELNPPRVTLTWTNDAALNNNLTFGAFQETFSISLDATNLFEMKLPRFTAPIGMTGLNVAVTPHFGFGPYFEAGWTSVLSGNQPHFSSASVEVGAEVSFGAAAELQGLYGLVSGGLDVTASGQVGFSAEVDAYGQWNYGIPLTLGLDFDLIGSVFWGAISGSFDLASFSVTTDLLSLTGLASVAPAAGITQAVSFDAGSGTTLLASPASAQSQAGDMAITWAGVDLAGTAQPLLVQQRSAAGVWGSVETVASSNNFRGEPSLAYLPDGRLMVLWSESTLDASAVAGMDGEAVAAAQEVFWSIREPTGWTTPQALTSNSVLDDQPALAVRSDGTAVAVWRHASGTDLDAPSVSDLWYTTFQSGSWSAPAVMVGDAAANGRPALAALPSGNILAAWLSASTATGEDAIVRSATLAGGAWSSAQMLSDTSGMDRLSPRLLTLGDGRVLAFWTEETPDGQTLRMAIRSSGGAWGASSEVLPAQKLVALPVICRSGSRVSVVWHGVGQESNLYTVSRDFADDHGWTAPQLLTPESGQVWWPMAGTDAAGQLDVVYALDGVHPMTLMLPTLQADGTGFQYRTVASLPDLSVSSEGLTLANTPAEPGVVNTVRMTVTNVGRAASTAAEVSLYDGDPAAGGVLIGTQPLTALAIGGTATVNFTWVPTAGMHNLWAVVDPTHSVSELGTTNNQAVAAFAAVAAPTLTLDPASDTGTPGDGRTTDTTPTITGSASGAGFVALLVDSQSSSVSQATATGGAYSVTLPPLTNGQHTIWAQAYDSGGNPSPFSASLAIFIEEAAFAAPQVDAASDTGAAGDGITSQPRPVLLGQAKPLATVRVWNGGVLLGETTAASNGTYAFTPSADLAEGRHGLTAVQVDAAGNSLGESAPLSLTIDRTAVKVQSVSLNSRPSRSVSAIDPSGTGVRTIEIHFSEPATFDAGSVTIEKVEFGDGGEQVVATVTPASVLGSGSDTMTITLDAGLACDTWVKVRVKATDAVADVAANALDGEAPAAGSGRGYIYSAALDLPTGDGAAGGDAVFYVGSLRGDFNGDLSVGPDDREGFATAWGAKSLDADFRGVGFGPRPPDGRVTLSDIDGFTAVYQRALATNLHLDELPGTGGGQAAGFTQLSSSSLPANQVDILVAAAGQVKSASAGLLQAAAGEIPLAGFGSALAATDSKDNAAADEPDVLAVKRLRPVRPSSASLQAVLRV